MPLHHITFTIRAELIFHAKPYDPLGFVLPTKMFEKLCRTKRKRGQRNLRWKFEGKVVALCLDEAEN